MERLMKNTKALTSNDSKHIKRSRIIFGQEQLRPLSGVDVPNIPKKYSKDIPIHIFDR